MIRSLGALLIAATLTSWPTPPPAIPPIPAMDEYFGHTVVDPYRNLEHLNDPTVKNYISDQTAYTRAILRKLDTGREAVRAVVSQLDDAGTTLSNFALAGGRVFYLERAGNTSDARLMVADARSAIRRLLLDPHALAEHTRLSTHFSLTDIMPSPDGEICRGRRRAKRFNYGNENAHRTRRGRKANA